MKPNLARKPYLLVITTLILVLALSGTAFAGRLDFTLVNDTGFDIYEVYITQSSSKDWGEDVMDRDILADGESVDIYFDKSENSPSWDLLVRDKKNNEYVWENIDLRKVSRITLYYKKGNTYAEFD